MELYLVMLSVLVALANEEAIVQEAMMGQCDAFWLASGARCVLDLCRGIKLQGCFCLSKQGLWDMPCSCLQICPAQRAWAIQQQALLAIVLIVCGTSQCLPG